MTAKADQGQLDAHTPRAASADDAWNAPIGSDQALPGTDPLDLLAGLPDGEGDDVLALAAEFIAAPARARGRPAGAANRKNGDMIRYLALRGHRDPWVTLSLIQSADFGQLCKMVGADTAKTKIAVLGLMKAAATDIMNYHHAKKPQQIELPIGDKRPLMVIGEMNVTTFANVDGFMSAGVMPPEKPNEINGDIVRPTDETSHE